MAKVIGIDLGTTNSCVALYDGDPVVIANSEGARTTPSVIAFTSSGEKLVGQIAKRQTTTNPEQTIFATKRLVGRKRESAEVEQFASVAPFDIVAAENGDAWVRAGDRELSPQEISATVLAKMKDTASEYVGEPVVDAVITVPAYFDDSQRQATQDAGRIAGLNVLRIINEPTAAALAFGLGEAEGRRVAIFDLGGGTFDISILEIEDGVFEVKSTNGDTYLGGEDFDQRITEFLIESFYRMESIDLREDKMALQRLKEAAERAKHELSSCEQTDVNLPFIAADETGPIHLSVELNRTELEALVEDIVERVVEPCRMALADADLTAGDIDEVVLVGGTTRMPIVQRKVEEVFERPVRRSVDPDEVVACGAAIQAGVLSGAVSDVLLLDVTPLSLGVETQGGVATPIIERNTTVPTSGSRVFSTTEDAQSVVRIHVVQGEREFAADNKTLGRFELVGIPPAPRGVPQIEVHFDIDANGVVNVSAQDLGTGRSQAIQVTASGGLSEQDVDQLVEEAAEHVEADRKRREWVDLCNEAEGLIYSTERTLEEFADTVEPQEREALEVCLEKTRATLMGDAILELRAAVDELSALTYQMTESLYAALGESDTPSGGAADSS
ncbi:molecular chaperone DnaK [Myxococcota bacterium]|nr:molecular chaperone DnaK [Myxococcota bacterium]